MIRLIVGRNVGCQQWARPSTPGQIIFRGSCPGPDQSHVQVLRQRPPRRRTASGWRASNGRSRLQLVQVRRQGVWRFEPKVSVLVSPELRAPVLQATALHELGHAFGLWGHSPDPGDAMAVHQGQDPVLKLSARDLETLLWLRQLSTRLGTSEGNQNHEF